MIFWLWVKDREKKEVFPLQISKGWQERFMTGRIWSWAITEYKLMQSLTCHSPGKDAQTLQGSTHSLHTCFSHVAVTPCLSLWTGDIRLELLMLARPICSIHWGSCFLQGIFQHLEMCHEETGEHGKDSPATRPPVTGLLLLDWLLPGGCDYSEHSVLQPMFPLLSNMTNSFCSLLLWPVMTPLSTMKQKDPQKVCSKGSHTWDPDKLKWAAVSSKQRNSIQNNKVP